MKMVLFGLLTLGTVSAFALEDCTIDIYATGKSGAFIKIEIATDGNIEVHQGFPSNDRMSLTVPCGSTSSFKWYVRGHEGAKYQLEVTTTNGLGDAKAQKTLKSSGFDYGSYTFIN